MMVRRLFVTFGLVIVLIAYQSAVQAVWAEQEQTSFQSEQEIIGGSKLQLMPLLLQEKENQCTGLKKFLNDLLGIFACDSEQYQNITMPSQLAIQGEAGESVKGVATATSEGQVRGITTIISDIASLLGFTSKALSGPNEGALLKYFPNSFKDTLTQSGNPNADIKKAVKEGQCMNMPLALQQGCGAQQGTAYYIPPADTVPALPVPTFAPISGAQTATARSVRQLAKLAGDWAGVPWQIVEAMLIVEGSSYSQGVDLNNIDSGVFAFTPTELALYQQPNAVASLLCSPNACSAAGVMQMTTAGCVPFDTCEVKKDDATNVNCNSCSAACIYKPSAWSGYKNAVLEAQDDGRTPNICNIKDSVFAGAKKMKADSGTAFGVLADWDYTTVTRVTNSYYGSCVRCGAAASNPGARYACERLGKTYCDFVWDYYQQRKNVSLEIPVSPQVPIEGFDDNAQVIVDNLVNGIRSSCVYENTTGRVNKDNVDCLENVNPTIENEARSALRNSAILFKNLQCVGFSIASERLVSGGFLETEDDIGAAIDYARIVPQGFRFINKSNPTQVVKAGDHLLWNVGAYGHIAYVERVYDTNTIQVAEANWVGPGVVRMRNVTLDQSGIIGWLSRL